MTSIIILVGFLALGLFLCVAFAGKDEDFNNEDEKVTTQKSYVTIDVIKNELNEFSKESWSKRCFSVVEQSISIDEVNKVERIEQDMKEKVKTYEVNARKARSRQQKEDYVKEVHRVFSYNDIFTRLDEYYIDGKFDRCMDLLEVLYELNVDTGEILEKVPYVWKACLQSLAKVG